MQVATFQIYTWGAHPGSLALRSFSLTAIKDWEPADGK